MTQEFIFRHFGELKEQTGSRILFGTNLFNFKPKNK
jgi:hypothetical protein